MSNTISTRIRYIRETRGYTQEYVANDVGITRTAFTMYEAGTRKPSCETLVALCNVFNVSADYLLGRSASTQGEGKLVLNKDTSQKVDFILKYMMEKFDTELKNVIDNNNPLIDNPDYIDVSMCSDGEKREILNYINYIISKREDALRNEGE
jgi:transcriptional regulator with XRE-family HTH domain